MALYLRSSYIRYVCGLLMRSLATTTEYSHLCSSKRIAHSVSSQFLDISAMRFVWATWAAWELQLVPEGHRPQPDRPQPPGMDGVGTGLWSKSRFVLISSNVTELVLSSVHTDATVGVGKEIIRFIESFCLLWVYSWAFVLVSLVGISLAAHEGFLFLNDRACFVPKEKGETTILQSSGNVTSPKMQT